MQRYQIPRDWGICKADIAVFSVKDPLRGDIAQRLGYGRIWIESVGIEGNE